MAVNKLATSDSSGMLRYIGDPSTGYAKTAQCYIRVPSRIMKSADANTSLIKFYALPDLSDTKSANYNSEHVPGRSASIKTYSHSDDRQIGITLHFVTDCYDRIWENLMYLRMLQSAVYPQYHSETGANYVPYYPPPVCKIMVGVLLSTCPLCAVLKSYSVRYPTDVAWDETTLLPGKFDVETSWEVVYRPSNLPGQEKILMDLATDNMGSSGSSVYNSLYSSAQQYGSAYQPC